MNHANLLIYSVRLTFILRPFAKQGRLAWLLLAVLTNSAGAQVLSKSFGPTKGIHVTRPVIRWEVWCKIPGQHIDITAVTLNGDSLNASYSGHEILAPLKGALAPGLYNVNIAASVASADGPLGTIKKDWSFTVLPDATDKLPDQDKANVDAIAQVNALRALMGLTAVTFDARLAEAAHRHCDFLDTNKLRGHFEKEGMPLFCGVNPAERLSSFDFVEDSWEVIAYGHDKNSDAIQDLFNAPYHRFAFMQPGTIALGLGQAKDTITMEFGGTACKQVVVSPGENQTGVSCGWVANERPNPLRLWTQDRSCGYPIVMAFFGDDAPCPRLVEAHLKAGAQEVATNINSPDNDSELKKGFILLPKERLKPNTAYSVQVIYKVQDNTTCTREWTFRTGS